MKGSLSLRLEEYFKAKGLENKKVGGKVGADITNGNRDCQISDKAVEKIDTKKELAKIAGVSHDTIYKVKEIKSQTPAEILSELEGNNLSCHLGNLGKTCRYDPFSTVAQQSFANWLILS